MRVEADTPELARLNDMVPAAPDRFWAISWAFAAGEARRYATMVAADGTAIGGAVPIPNTDPVGGTRHGLVHNAGGRMFLFGAGEARDLGPGVALGAWADAVAYSSCGGPTSCSVELLAVDSGTTIGSYVVPAAVAVRGREGFTVAIGEDASLALVPVRLTGLAWGRSGGVVSTTLAVSGEPGSFADVVVQSPKAGPAWLPDGDGVLMLTGLGLVHFDQRSDDLGQTVASGLRPERETAMFTIPS